VYRPAFYGFVLPALVPLIVRVALEGDEVHWYIRARDERGPGLRARLRPPAQRRADAARSPRATRTSTSSRSCARSRARRTRRGRARKPPITARASSWPRRATICASRCTRWACTSPHSRHARRKPRGSRSS
jgi:hypothetical protein